MRGTAPPHYMLLFCISPNNTTNLNRESGRGHDLRYLPHISSILIKINPMLFNYLNKHMAYTYLIVHYIHIPILNQSDISYFCVHTFPSVCRQTNRARRRCIDIIAIPVHFFTMPHKIKRRTLFFFAGYVSLEILNDTNLSLEKVIFHDSINSAV